MRCRRLTVPGLLASMLLACGGNGVVMDGDGSTSDTGTTGGHDAMPGTDAHNTGQDASTGRDSAPGHDA